MNSSIPIPRAPTSANCAAFPGQEFNEHTWQAQLIQPIVDVAAYYTYKSAKALKAQAEQDYISSEQDLIVRTVSAYLEVLRSQAALDSTNAEEAAVKRQQEQVQQRFDVGLVAITDVLDATAAYDNVVVRRIQAERDQGIRFEDLYKLTGASYAEVDQVSTNLPIVNPASVDENEWVAIALANNPTVLASRQAQVAAERDLRARQAGHLPTVDAIASYNEGINHYNQLAGGQAFPRRRDRHPRVRDCSSSCRFIRAATRRRKCAKRARGCCNPASSSATTNGPSAATRAICCAPSRPT